MCGYILCIRIIDFMLKGKSLYNCINLSYPKKYEKSDKTILKVFQ